MDENNSADEAGNTEPAHHENKTHEHHAEHSVHHEAHHNTEAFNSWMIISIVLAVLLAVSLYMNYNLVLNKGTTTPTTTPSTQTPAQTQQQAQPENIPKTDKPSVELFVMTHCPYGLQAEKGILPAIRQLGNKIDFNIRFVYYAMHGQKEVTEELNQYCIKTEQSDKYLDYLACFVKAGDSASCLDTAKVDKTKLNACIPVADKKFSVTDNFNDKSKWLSGQFPMMNFDADLNQKYSVQGSPTLVINGVESSAGRSPQSYLSAICGSFKNAPSECKTQISATQPGAGFGYNTAADATAAGCGV